MHQDLKLSRFSPTENSSLSQHLQNNIWKRK